jgi:hypothetical protein
MQIEESQPTPMDHFFNFEHQIEDLAINFEHM